MLLVSGPPFSQFLMAPLARAAGVGVVLDYRDEWSTLRTSYEMSALDRRARARRSARSGAPPHARTPVVTATDEFRANLLARFPFLDPARVHAVPNGYDPDDFPRDLPDPPRDRFVVTYAGTVFALTSARGLLGAVRRLHARDAQAARAVARPLRRAHRRDGGRCLRGEPRRSASSASGYVPHGDVLRELAASHLTLCLLDDVAGAERIYPAKIFELMHLGRPDAHPRPAGAARSRASSNHTGSVPLFTRATRSESPTPSARALQDPAPRPNGSPGAWRNAPGLQSVTTGELSRENSRKSFGKRPPRRRDGAARDHGSRHVSAFVTCRPRPCGGDVGCRRRPPTTGRPRTLSAIASAPATQLKVVVWKHDELSTQVAVRPDGAISLPLVGDVPATGRSASRDRRRRPERLHRFYQDDPPVTLQVQDVKSYKIYVVGEVNKPGEFAPSQEVTVLMSLSLAGGFTRFADADRIVIVRRDARGERRIPFDYSAVVSHGDLQENIALELGDTVIVP